MAVTCKESTFFLYASCEPLTYLLAHPMYEAAAQAGNVKRQAGFKGVLHLLPKISMFCAPSQNNQQLFEK